MEKENIFFRGEQNRGRKIRNKFGDGKYVFCRGKINSRRKTRKIFGEGKYVFLRRRRKTGKEKGDHLEKAGPS